MTFYHSKPAQIEAWLYDGSRESRSSMMDLLGSEGRIDMGADIAHLMIKSNNGWVELHPEHFLMQGVSDFYPCDPKTFDVRWAEGPLPMGSK